MFIQLTRSDNGNCVFIHVPQIIAYNVNDAGTGTLINLNGGIVRDVTETVDEVTNMLTTWCGLRVHRIPKAKAK
jgi:hypothetical protein